MIHGHGCPAIHPELNTWLTPGLLALPGLLVPL